MDFPHIVHISPPNFPFHESTMLPTPRALHFPTLHVLYFPPATPTGSLCAHIATLGHRTSSVSISHDKGSGNFPTPPAVEQSGLQPSGGYGHVFPSALTYFISFLSFFLRHLVLDICNTLVLALENWGVVVGIAL